LLRKDWHFSQDAGSIRHHDEILAPHNSGLSVDLNLVWRDQRSGTFRGHFQIDTQLVRAPYTKAATAAPAPEWS
jgi:hypothetical protein